MLLYFTLPSHSLFLSFDFIFALLHSCFALFHCALLCFMLCFPHSLQLSRLLCSCSVSLHLSSLSIRFILPYFALFSFHYIPVCFALLRFFTLPRFDLLHFALLSLFFLVQFSAPVLTSSLLGDIARPSIPCSTCFVEPRAILLPLIPLCSVSHEPRALEKSEPDWRRYVIYSPCRNETKRRPPFWFYAMHFNRGFNVATARFED